VKVRFMDGGYKRLKREEFEGLITEVGVQPSDEGRLEAQKAAQEITKGMEVGQHLYLKGTGKWSEENFGAVVMDVRAEDDSVKVKYGDGGFKRMKREEFENLISEAFLYAYQNVLAVDVEGMTDAEKAALAKTLPDEERFKWEEGLGDKEQQALAQENALKAYAEKMFKEMEGEHGAIDKENFEKFWTSYKALLAEALIAEPGGGAMRDQMRKSVLTSQSPEAEKEKTPDEIVA